MRSHPPRPRPELSAFELLPSMATTLLDREERDVPPYYIERGLDGSGVLETIEPAPQRATWARSGPIDFSAGASQAFRARVADVLRRNGR